MLKCCQPIWIYNCLIMLPSQCGYQPLNLPSLVTGCFCVIGRLFWSIILCHHVTFHDLTKDAWSKQQKVDILLWHYKVPEPSGYTVWLKLIQLWRLQHDTSASSKFYNANNHLNIVSTNLLCYAGIIVLCCDATKENAILMKAFLNQVQKRNMYN